MVLLGRNHEPEAPQARSPYAHQQRLVGVHAALDVAQARGDQISPGEMSEVHAQVYEPGRGIAWRSN